jgi:transposase
MKQAQKRQKNFTEEEKQLIIQSYEVGVKATALSKQMNKSVSSISTFISRWKLNSALPPKEKKCRSKISGRMGTVVKKIVTDNPKLGLKKLCAKIKEATPTSLWHPKKTCLQKFLSKSGFKKRHPSLKPPLSAANRAKRLAFAKKWMNGNVCTLENVIWTDECRVASNPNNRRISLWTNTGEVPNQVKMHSGGNSVMFWGCFSQHGTGNLVSLKGTMDGKEYVEVLKENLLEEFKNGKKNIPGTWRLMQDNAPCHTSKLVKGFLARHKIEFIDWPPYSPDLNPIENIWSWMKHILDVEYSVCQSAEEIEERFFEIWRKITPEMCGKYCANYERRLLAVIEAKGGYTKY